jgi:hypothetical protein
MIFSTDSCYGDMVVQIGNFEFVSLSAIDNLRGCCVIRFGERILTVGNELWTRQWRMKYSNSMAASFVV